MIVSSGYMKIGFDAYGGSYLAKSDMGFWMNMPERTDKRGICFELKEDVTGVEPGFFELVPTIKELRMLAPDCRLFLTDGEKELFRKNGVLIRGRFDASAERFAKEQGLMFLHTDEFIGRSGNYYEHGVNTVTLRFHLDGSAYVNQDCRYQGSSPGWDGGGETNFDLPKDFFLNMSAEDVAGECWGSCYSDILKRGVLASLIKKARSKKGFLVNYTGKDLGFDR